MIASSFVILLNCFANGGSQNLPGTRRTRQRLDLSFLLVLESYIVKKHMLTCFGAKNGWFWTRL